MGKKGWVAFRPPDVGGEEIVMFARPDPDFPQVRSVCIHIRVD